ncbi:MAG: hypothetical protein WC426_01700 [Sulfuriferula sp.]
MKKLFLLSLILLLSACGSQKIEGDYASNVNKESFAFHKDGTVTEKINGLKTAEYPYNISGDQIKIGTFVTLRQIKDGSGDLDGGLMFGRLVKK